jgi:hypothetical protein
MWVCSETLKGAFQISLDAHGRISPIEELTLELGLLAQKCHDFGDVIHGSFP